MNDRMMQEAAGYTARRRRRHLWRKIVGVLAAVAVFGTTYALILPAITLEKTGCSIPEHTHTQACGAGCAAYAHLHAGKSESAPAHGGLL